MTRRALVIATGLFAVIVFTVAALMFDRYSKDPSVALASAEGSTLVRAHSPTIGPADAAVTIVEFFDPSCEACRAFYPYVKELLLTYPEDVRLVLRYAAFHEGSNEAVRILEAARKQEKFEEVLFALFANQPEWAVHGAPNMTRAWEIAGAAGLDLERARTHRHRLKSI